MAKYTIGISFDELGAEAALVNTAGGEVAAKTVNEYPHRAGDSTHVHPMDFLDVITAAVASLRKKSGVAKEEITGLGIAMASGKPIPVMKDGTPLSFFREYDNVPEAMPDFAHGNFAEEARVLNECAVSNCESFNYSHPSGFAGDSTLAKLYALKKNHSRIYETCDCFIETADWIVWQLCGKPVMNSYAAGIASVWDRSLGWPDADFLASVGTGFDKLKYKLFSFPVKAAGNACGKLAPAVAGMLGLSSETVVSVAADSVLADMLSLGVTSPGKLYIRLSDSVRCLCLGREELKPDGVTAFGKDLFYAGADACYAEFKPDIATASGLSDQSPETAKKASALLPGEAGIVMTDDIIAGLDNNNTPADLYRAAMERELFKLRLYVDELDRAGARISRIMLSVKPDCRIFTGGKMLAELFGTELSVSLSDRAELGAAIFAAVASGVYPDIRTAARAMGSDGDLNVITPDDVNVEIYEKLYREFKRLHGFFSPSSNNIKGRLEQIKGMGVRNKTVKEPESDIGLTREIHAWSNADDEDYEAEAPTLESEFGFTEDVEASAEAVAEAGVAEDAGEAGESVEAGGSVAGEADGSSAGDGVTADANDGVVDGTDVESGVEASAEAESEPSDEEIRAAAEAAAKELFEAVDAVAAIRDDAEIFAAFKELVEEEAEKHTREIIAAADEVAKQINDAETDAIFKDIIEEEAEKNTQEIIAAADEVVKQLEEAEHMAYFGEAIEEEAEKSTREIIAAADEVVKLMEEADASAAESEKASAETTNSEENETSDGSANGSVASDAASGAKSDNVAPKSVWPDLSDFDPNDFSGIG